MPEGAIPSVSLSILLQLSSRSEGHYEGKHPITHAQRAARGTINPQSIIPVRRVVERTTMHTKAQQRMRQLIVEALDKLHVDNGRLVFGQAQPVLTPLGEFIAKNFSDYLREDISSVYMYYAVQNALEALGQTAVSGALATSLDQVQ